MIDCTKTENFLRERFRMCISHNGCSGCGLSDDNNGTDLGCGDFCGKHPKEAISIVQEWSDEHSQRTMLDKFKEDYPNAPIGTAKIPFLCPHTVGYEGQEYMTKNCRHTNSSCVECWNRPYGGEQK